MIIGEDGGPCIGIMRFNIFVHRILEDGSVEMAVQDCSKEFEDMEMSDTLEIKVIGFTKAECIESIKNKLEKLL